MIGQMRGKFGGYIVAAIIGFIALVFAFEGVFGPKATRGLHEGAVAGTVNGEPISIGDYNKALQRQLDYVKGMMGGKITEEQMKMFGIRDRVFKDLTQQKLMSQAALDSGRAPSDEAVRQEIMTLPYFQKDGKFDPMQYKGVLEANHYSPAMFEKSIREQLAVEDWQKSFANGVRVSESELKEEFQQSQNQRSYKYVQIPAQAAKQKDLTPKDAADKVVGMLKADKKSDEAVNAFLKPFGVQVRDTPNAPENAPYLAGAQENPQIVKDLFGGGLEVGKAKVYESKDAVTVILLTEVKKPDPSKFEATRGELMQQIRARKERDLMTAVMKKLTDKARIDVNPAVIGASGPEEG